MRRFPKSRVTPAERGRMRDEIREVDFPIALRGYDRAAVDRYVQQVNRVIAELEISSSPESAIRRALEEVSEETSGLLQRAYETADEIAARSRAKADDRLEQAKREAAELREAAASEAQEMRKTAQRETQELGAEATREAHELRETAAHETHELRETAAREAKEVRAAAERESDEMRAGAEARVGELDRNASAIRRERLRLIEDMRAVARQQLEIAEAAETRFQSALPGTPEAEEELAPADEPTSP
jgi:DivIVA domain-containing protein